MTQTDTDKAQLLAETLGTPWAADDFTECDYDHYGLTVFKCGSKEYAVGTDAAAADAARAYIRDSVWAFNSEFLRHWTGVPGEIMAVWQEKQCENANDEILNLIGEDFDHFADAAISADGRGHFLSGYDGNENEHPTADFYVYRIN